MVEFAVILVEPLYEGNIGGVARVMKNFGFGELVLVKPPKLGGEARAKAMHGREILRKAGKATTLGEAAKDFDYLVATSAVSASDTNTLRTPVAPEELAVALKKKGRVGLVFGREDAGLTNDEIKLCDMLVTIPANPEYPTLNIAQSVGIILYEISRQRMRQEFGDKKKYQRLSKIEKDVLLRYFDGLADTLYTQDFEKRLAKKTFRQLIARSFVSGREATTLTGVFRRAGERVRR